MMWQDAEHLRRRANSEAFLLADAALLRRFRQGGRIILNRQAVGAGGAELRPSWEGGKHDVRTMRYDAAAGTAECPRCGTRVAGNTSPATDTPAWTPVSGAAGHESASSGYNFDARRWALSDEIAGAASLVVLISLFLPWSNASYIPFASSTATSGGPESGMDAHGWLSLVFIVVLAILILGYALKTARVRCST
jgi:hypothetical protein